MIAQILTLLMTGLVSSNRQFRYVFSITYTVIVKYKQFSFKGSFSVSVLREVEI